LFAIIDNEIETLSSRFFLYCGSTFSSNAYREEKLKINDFDKTDEKGKYMKSSLFLYEDSYIKIKLAFSVKSNNSR